MNCRHCGSAVTLPFIDLGTAPPSNAFLTAAQLNAPEKWFPLRVKACSTCWLVQTDDYAHHAELFSADYAYFSSYSTTWLRHAEQYVSLVVDRFQLGCHSRVIEVASNDGYLLQYVSARGIPCLGVEPTRSTANAARAKGLEVVEEFFGRDLAERFVAEERGADLLVANNVLAHVPDINDFASGVARVLKPDGVATFEFPHLLQLVSGVQFDTIYHEHFSYLSLTSVMNVLGRNELEVFDVEEIPTHGGSLRVFAERAGSETGRQRSPRVQQLIDAETRAGVTRADFYMAFQQRADAVKDEFLSFLLEAKRRGKGVAGYGAAAKGSTLLNYAGVRGDLLSFVVDRNPAKQGSFMPGSRVPILDEAALASARPDYIVVFPWNLKDEVIEQLAYARGWGAAFVTAIPRLEVAS